MMYQGCISDPNEVNNSPRDVLLMLGKNGHICLGVRALKEMYKMMLGFDPDIPVHPPHHPSDVFFDPNDVKTRPNRFYISRSGCVRS
jgi:hypothetical protein